MKCGGTSINTLYGTPLILVPYLLPGGKSIEGILFQESKILTQI